ncbi:MAG: hypothetical protein JOZ14_04330 [Acidobacteria bacterium]|nr:hypothetical protein [Acidobacteriota bacterium]
MKDAFDVQDDIAHSISQALRISLSPQEEIRSLLWKDHHDDKNASAFTPQPRPAASTLEARLQSCNYVAFKQLRAITPTEGC